MTPEQHTTRIKAAIEAAEADGVLVVLDDQHTEHMSVLTILRGGTTGKGQGVVMMTWAGPIVEDDE